MERERAINRIVELFNIFTLTIQSHNKIGLFDKNSFSEDVMIPILREIYGFSYLRNLNREKQNFPGFDLADDHARVAVQVTSDHSLDKVKSTLSQVSEHRLYERYDRFCILTIVKKQKAYSEKSLKPYLNGHFSFTPKSDIIDFDDLVLAIKTLELSQIQRIELTLEINFSKPARYFLAQQVKPETESLILNLASLTLPAQIYIGKTIYDRDEVIANSAESKFRVYKNSDERDIARAALTQMGLSSPTGWVIRSGELISFYNLRDEQHPLSKLIDPGTADPIPIEDYYGRDENQERTFKDLLRRTFQSQAYNLGIKWQNQEKLFIFISRSGADKRFVKLPNSTRGGRVVYEKVRSKKDTEKIIIHKHLAFETQFFCFGDKWFIALEPNWFFSWDGYKRSRYHERNVSHIKKNYHNDFVLTYLQLIHAALTLEDRARLFSQDDASKIIIGDLATVDGSLAVNDAEWLQLEAKKRRKALLNKDDIPTIGGYDEVESDS